MEIKIIHKPRSYSKKKNIEMFTFSNSTNNNSNITFDKFLKYFYLNDETYILVLIIQLKKPQFFGEQTLNIFNKCFQQNNSHIWFANIHFQFILYAYAIVTYCTSYMTKINISIKMHYQPIHVLKTQNKYNNTIIRQCFFKCTTNVYSTSCDCYFILAFTSLFRIIQIYKHLSIPRMNICT